MSYSAHELYGIVKDNPGLRAGVLRMKGVYPCDLPMAAKAGLVEHRLRGFASGWYVVEDAPESAFRRWDDDHRYGPRD